MIHTQSTIKVRYAETDKMGLVHHRNYVAYFEHSRVELLDALGVPYRELEETGYFLPVIEMNIRYLRPNTFDDVLTVHCIMEETPKVKIRLKYEVYRDGLLTTTGSSLHGFVDKNGKPVRPPKCLLEAVAKLTQSA